MVFLERFRRLDAAVLRRLPQFDRVVHCTDPVVETVTLQTELSFSFLGTRDLRLQLVTRCLKFLLQVLDLSILVLFDQRELILRCLKLSQQLRLLFLPCLHLLLKDLDLIL